MPLRGENKVFPTYTQLHPIPGGSHGLIQLGFHVGYGVACVQKTYDRRGREDAAAYGEPRLLRLLDHPHIVKIFDVQPDGDLDYAITMVMPAYPGGSLHGAIGGGKCFSVGQTIELAAQIADALDYLHTTHRLMHRDVKPQNLLLDAKGNLALCDFGTAAIMNKDDCTGPVRASLPYQPPETAGHGFMTAKSDVYSLGLTTIEMLQGSFLYDGLDAAVVQRRVDSGRRGYGDAALASSARPPHVPAALRSLLSRCVALDANARPTAAELVRELNQLAVIDWRREEGAGLDGRWVGSWPPRARADRAVRLEVTSRVLAAGRFAGQRRMEARYRKTSTSAWRTLGSRAGCVEVPDTQDAAAVSRFFRIVSDVTAHRFPA